MYDLKKPDSAFIPLWTWRRIKQFPCFRYLRNYHTARRARLRRWTILVKKLYPNTRMFWNLWKCEIWCQYFLRTLAAVATSGIPMIYIIYDIHSISTSLFVLWSCFLPFDQDPCNGKVHGWMQFNALARVECAAGKVAGLKTNIDGSANLGGMPFPHRAGVGLIFCEFGTSHFYFWSFHSNKNMSNDWSFLIDQPFVWSILIFDLLCSWVNYCIAARNAAVGDLPGS